MGANGCCTRHHSTQSVEGTPPRSEPPIHHRLEGKGSRDGIPPPPPTSSAPPLRLFPSNTTIVRVRVRHDPSHPEKLSGAERSRLPDSLAMTRPTCSVQRNCLVRLPAAPETLDDAPREKAMVGVIGVCDGRMPAAAACVKPESGIRQGRGGEEGGCVPSCRGVLIPSA